MKLVLVRDGGVVDVVLPLPVAVGGKGKEAGDQQHKDAAVAVRQEYRDGSRWKRIFGMGCGIPKPGDRQDFGGGFRPDPIRQAKTTDIMDV